jgi:hypothetical protein
MVNALKVGFFALKCGHQTPRSGITFLSLLSLSFSLSLSLSLHPRASRPEPQSLLDCQ